MSKFQLPFGRSLQLSGKSGLRGLLAKRSAEIGAELGFILPQMAGRKCSITRSREDIEGLVGDICTWYGLWWYL